MRFFDDAGICVVILRKHALQRVVGFNRPCNYFYQLLIVEVLSLIWLLDVVKIGVEFAPCFLFRSLLVWSTSVRCEEFCGLVHVSCFNYIDS